MAEAPKGDRGGDKKGEKSEKKAVPLTVTFAEIVALIIFVLLILRLFRGWNFSSFFSGDTFSFSAFFRFLVESTGHSQIFYSILFALLFCSISLSVLFIFGSIYSSIKLLDVEKKLWQKFYPEPVSQAPEDKKHKKWERVLEHIGSENPGDWRLAILECDIMLDDLLDSLGLVGGTIGDKLKNAALADFRTLDNAWEAHKIRNAIAHQGQDFTLTEREARRIISLYESVFNEFKFI